MRKALYILGDLDEADIRWMAEAGQQGTVQAGQKLIEAGAPVEWLYIVVDGAFDMLLGALTNLIDNALYWNMNYLPFTVPAR